MAPILSGIFNVLLVLVSLFLIALVLIQRGKGGGLAGAFGGAGGSSAFGTKAGDIFTRVTMIVAGIWIALCMMLVVIGNGSPKSAWEDTPTAGSGANSKSKSTPLAPGKTAGLPPTVPTLPAPPPVGPSAPPRNDPIPPATPPDALPDPFSPTTPKAP